MSGNLAVFVPHAGCPNQCSFCDQRHISGHSEPPTPQQVAALCEQYLPADGSTEIAFFGGSFTAIDRDYMQRLLASAARYVQAGKAAGIRVSTRPDAVDTEVLALLRQYGVTAVELGAQSMDDAVLARNGRGHTAAQVISAAARVKAGGFSLGLQMMVGLDGADDPRDDALQTARAFLKIAPDTVRIYPTVVVAHTALYDRTRAGSYTPLTIEEAVDICAALVPLFEENDIRILRIGLHADETLAESVVAGPYHPALGEMVYARRMRTVIEQALKVAGGPARATVYVHPKDVSRAVGYRRGNITCFRDSGIELDVRADERLGRAAVRIETA